MSDEKQLSSFQLDALKEICLISAANAATAVSKMVKKKVEMGVPEVRLVPIAGVVAALGSSETLIVGIYSKIIGDLSGGFLLAFPRESAFALSDVLLKKKLGETKLLDDMDTSALKETGNIIAGAFVSALARMIKRSLLISVPRLAYDMAGAIIDFILIEVAEVAEYAVVLEIVFYDVPETVRGKFFILPDPNSLALLLSAIDMQAGGEELE
ncbi:MAG: hypothetical protein A2314_07790 [Elusimicrobia bacterium RIFOXYB2_FULL_50_12]|nr:MAG: hypothetical protein A2314_07790 [Elusimicrobia bacterium RIFOXYB2_FULL_50_12]